jgi:hypothetical protein
MNKGYRNKVRRSREKGLRVNALVPASEEGRNKLRKASGSRIWLRSGDVRMGKPGESNVSSSRKGGARGELKHLSTRRKRNQKRFRE